ncbi:MAG: calcium-binding protein, partial [Paracoccus sp. (in: a-proteobacteria)]|uniref:calcium-binding protein n=1 Tax=Paracoccus sp. TaxID=267 RepID=UPI0026DFA1A7
MADLDFNWTRTDDAVDPARTSGGSASYGNNYTFSADTGGVKVTAEITKANDGSSELNGIQLNAGSGYGLVPANNLGISTESVLSLGATAGTGSVGTAAFTFEGVDGSGYGDSVENVNFIISNLDVGGARYVDGVIVRAYDADGNLIPVSMTPTSSSRSAPTVTNNNTGEVTAIANKTNYTGGGDADTGVAINIAGPVSKIEVEYIRSATTGAGTSGGTSGTSVLYISDMTFGTTPAVNPDGIVDGTAGADVIDAVYVDKDGDVVDGNDNTLAGVAAGGVAGSNDDLINALAGDDTINSGNGNDTIYAGSGNDSIVANNGNNVIYGDQDYNSSVNPGTGNDTITTGAGNDLIYGDHNLTTGSKDGGDDLINAGDGENTVYGGGGDDTITTGAGNDLIDGGDGDDFINSGAGNDTVYGGAGDDTIVAGVGNDYLDGGEGDDSILGGAGDDTLLGGDGNDTIRGQAGSDLIYGGAGDDSIQGGFSSEAGHTFDDTIYGGDGDDTIDANVGDDLVYGDEGNDWIRGGVGEDTIYGGAGNDTLIGSEGNDLLHGGDGNDIIYGDRQNPEWTGDSPDVVPGNDTLFGDAGDDTLYAGLGNDYLDGGAGADWLAGNAGDDTFIAGSGDTIADFNFGNTGPINDGDQTNNDFVDLSGYYNETNLTIINDAREAAGLEPYGNPLVWMRADQEDDGVLNDISTANGFGEDFVFTIQNGGTAVAGDDLTWDNTNVVCFSADALIETARGPVRAGDLT